MHQRTTATSQPEKANAPNPLPLSRKGFEALERPMQESRYAEPIAPIVRAQASANRYGWNDAQLRTALESTPELTTLLQEQLLFRVLSLSLQKGYAWISREKLCVLLKCCDRTLRTAAKALTAAGLLTVVYRDGGVTWLPQWERLGLGDNPEHVAARATVSRQELPPHYKINDPDQQALEDQDQPDHSPERLEVRREILASSRDVPSPEPAADPLDGVLSRWGGSGYRAVLKVAWGPEGRACPQATATALVKLVGATKAVGNPGGYLRTLIRRERAGVGS